MRYLEGKRLGETLESDVSVIELALKHGWLPSQIRNEDWLDLQLLALVEEAQTKTRAELKRRADERKKRDEGR